MPNRTVFFISDGTGITAETFGNAILNQFETTVRRVRLPFLDNVDKAHQAVRQINHTADLEGNRPLVFTTVVDMDVLSVFRTQCKGVLLDMFGTFIAPLEHELGIKSNHRVGRFSDASKSQAYNDRIEAINFSLAHDDGQSHKDLQGLGRDPGRREPQRQDAHVPVPRHAVRTEGLELPPHSRKTLIAASCHRPWRRTARRSSV